MASLVRPQNIKIRGVFRANWLKESRLATNMSIVTDLTNVFRLVEPGMVLERTCKTRGCFAQNKISPSLPRFCV